MKAHVFFVVMMLCLLFPGRIFAVSVAPSLIEIEAERGEEISSSFTLINPSAEPETYYFRTIKFETNAENGRPQFLPNDRENLPSWMRFESTSFTVAPHTQIAMPFTVVIPPGTPSGGYYAAILVSETPSEIVAANGASVEASVAVLVLLTVEGETERRGALLDLQSPTEGKWLTTLHGSFSFRIQNQGNVHFEPKGRLEIRDFFGRKVLVAPVNQEGGRVLPGTTRMFSASFGPQEKLNFWDTVRVQIQTFAVGPVRAVLVLDEGLQETASADFGFWMLPWQSLLVFVGLAVVAVIVPRRFRKK
ncbi:MAG: hypothetical protein UY77_C0006G0002 [Candidatus Uhrbacteria bacterium GW2011_GWA2_53_10]|uniref:DUF916 domain-containing protein n=1 Tax=Candidatus Uhrbacteria bacterium GW2011_GWA2_53_10 TaxID=1618980 RepID=A0A0G1XQB1_9BACT|nr:MAG: hypothetical protein UY77_C0006G0002 [Candidatus Uhrbacteria bacterium GW2011_GWA2_53_10]